MILQEKARELMNSGAVESMAQAQMVAELVDMKFDEEGSPIDSLAQLIK